MEFHHEQESFGYSVGQVNQNLDRFHTNPQPVQLSINLEYLTVHKYVDRSSDHTVTTICQYWVLESMRHQFDMKVVKNYRQAYLTFSAMLSSIGIKDDTAVHFKLVEEIQRWASRIGNQVSNMGRKVLPLRAFIMRLHTMIHCERCLLDRVMRESMANANDQMVPASDEAIKKMLKRGRVKKESSTLLSVEEGQGRKKRRRVPDGDSCTVCLEEFTAGSNVAFMPCSHVFHANCIVRWLKESHYCPICRFQMPTNSIQTS